MNNIFSSMNDVYSSGGKIKEGFWDALEIPDNIRSAYGAKLKDYAKNLNKTADAGENAEASLSGFNRTLLEQGENIVEDTSLGEKFIDALKSGGKALLTSVGTGILDVGISMMLQTGLTALNDYINRNQIAIDKGKESQQTISDTFNTFSDGKTTLTSLGTSFLSTDKQITNTGEAIKSVAEEYTKLSSHVNSSDNSNIALSDEDYQTYLDLSNKLATLYPQLQTSTDAQGNAILNLGSNAEEATKSIQNLYDTAMLSANVKIGDELQQAFKGVSIQVKEYQKQVDDYKKEAENYRSKQEEASNFSLKIDTEDFVNDPSIRLDSRELGDTYGDYLDKVENILNKKKINYVESTDTLTDKNGNPYSVVDLGIVDPDVTEKQLTEVGNKISSFSNDIADEFSAKATELEKKSNSTTALIEDQWKGITDSLGQYLQTTDSFDKLDTNIQNALLKNLPNLDISALSKQYDGDALQFMYDQFITPLSDLSEDSQKALADVFNVDQAKMTTSEYAKSVNDALEKAFPDDAELQDKWKNNFGLSKVLEDNQKQLDSIKSGLNHTADTEVDNLTGQDRQIAYNIITNDGFSGTFEKLQSQIEETKNQFVGETMLSELQSQVTDVQKAYSNLSSAMSESMSATGTTSDSITNIKSSLESLIESDEKLKDFDLNSLFTNTSKGVKLNNDKLKNMLELQHNIQSKDFADAISKQNQEIQKQKDALSETTKGTQEYTDAQEKLKTAQSQLSEMQQAQSQYHAQYQQMRDMFSEYTQWQQAQSTENAGDKYNNMLSGLKSAKEAYDKGLIGTDDFKTFAKMLSPSGSTDDANFAENYGKAARYLTEDESGLVHFFEDLSTKTDDAGNKMAKFNEQTQQWELNAHDLGEIAQKLGTGESLVEALFGRAEDYGATSTVITDMEDGVLKTSEAIEKRAEAQSHLNQMEEANKQARAEGKDDIYNTTAIEAARQEVEKYTQLIDGLKESMDYLSKHSSDSSQEQQIKTATDEIKQMKQEYDNLMQEANGNTESAAYKTAQQLKDSIQQKANESNLELDAELNITGVKASAQEELQKAQQSGQISADIDLDYDKSSMSLDQLNSKIQELNNEKVRIQTEADTSESEETLNQLDTEISALQQQKVQVEIQTALDEGNTVESLLTMSDQDLMVAVQCDSSEVDTVRSELQSMQGGDIQVPMTVKLDETQFSQLTGTKDLQVNVTPKVAEAPTIPDGKMNATVTVENPPEIPDGTVKATATVDDPPEIPKGKVDVVATVKPDKEELKVSASPVLVNVEPDPQEVEVSVKDATVKVTPVPQEVTVKATAQVTGTEGQTSDGTINYKKGNVEKADGTTSKGIINYKKGDVEKADGTVSTGVINYNLGTVATPKGMVATGVINYTLGSVARPGKVSGTMISVAHANGTMYNAPWNYRAITPAHAKGNVALGQDERALVNELGMESMVRDGVWSMIPGGAHLENLKKGDIIFSAQQTKDLLEHGKISGHARAYAQGSLSDISLTSAYSVGGMSLGFKGGLSSPKYGGSSSNSSSTPSYSSNTSATQANTKATNSNTNATKKNTSAFDYVAQRLSYFANKTKAIADKITDYVSSAFKTSQLKKQMNAISSEINVNTKAAEAYRKKANSVGLTAAQKKAVREGKYSIVDYDTSSSGNTKTTYDKLSDYKKYYDEYVKCTQAVQELKNQQMELFEQWANMPTENAEKKLERLKNGFKGLTAIQARLNVANLGGSAQSLLRQQMANTVNSARSNYTTARTNKQNAQAKYNSATATQKSAQSQANKDSKALKTAANRLKSNKNITLTAEERKRINSGQVLSTKGLTGAKKKAVEQYNKAARKNKSSQSKLTSAKSATATAKSNLQTANSKFTSARSMYSTYSNQYKEMTKYLNSGDTVGYQNYLADAEVSNKKSQNAANQAAYKQTIQNRQNIERQRDAADPSKIRAKAKEDAKKKGSSILKTYSKKLTASQKKALQNGTKVDTRGITDKTLLNRLNAYNKFLDDASAKAKESQSKYTKLSQELTIAQNAEMEAAATAAESEAEYVQAAIEAEQTKFENISKYYDNKLDYEKALSEKAEKARDLADARGEYTNSSDYDTQIISTQNQQNIQAEKAKKLQEQLDNSVKSGRIKEGSDEWLQMKAQIVEAENAVADYNTQLENLKQQKLTTYFEEQFDRAIKKADQFINKLDTINSLLTDDMMYDYDTGSLTDFGALSLVLNAQEMNSSLDSLQKYIKKRQEIIDKYNSKEYGQKTFDDLMSENDSNIQNALKNANSYKQTILSIITTQAQKEQDALFKVMDAHKKALKKKKEYYDYDKSLKKSVNEINLLQQQIAALEGVTDAESKAQKARLEAQLKEKQDDMDDTVRDHIYDLQVDGLDDLQDQLSEDFEKWSKELAFNLEKMSQAINDAVANAGGAAADAMNTLAQVLKQLNIKPEDIGLSESDLDTSSLPHYAKGTKHVGGVPRLAVTNEKGRELIVTKEGILTPVMPSDGIVPDDLTSTLMRMAVDYQNFDMPEIKMPEIELVSKKDDGEGGNVYIHYDTLLTVQGDVTKDALPDLKTILKQASEYTQNDIRKNRRRFG